MRGRATIGGVIERRDWAKQGRTVLACRDCGQHVTDPLAEAEIIKPSIKVVNVGGIPRDEPTNVEIPMGLCEACRTRRARATAILDRRPMLAHSLGSRSHGDVVVDSALAAFDALGIEDGLESAPIRELRLALQHLSTVGAGIRWSALFAPVLMPEAQPNTTAPSRWGYVNADQLQELRDSYARFMRALIFRPSQVPPPEEEAGRKALRGCLFCGIGTVTAGYQDSNPWGLIRSAEPHLIGGKGSSQKVFGYLCPDCQASMEKHSITALGRDALDAVMGDFLGCEIPNPLDYSFLDPTRLRVLKLLSAWAVSGKPPSTERWAHLGDKDKVRLLISKF